MRRTLPLLAVLLMTASPADAAPFGYTDPAGDALTAAGQHDIRKVTWTAKGTGRGKSFRPTHVIVTLQLAAPPDAGPGVEYAVYADEVSGCGDMSFHYAPGTVLGASKGYGFAVGSCVQTVPTLANVTLYERVVDTVVKGSSIQWTLPVDLTDLDRTARVSGHSALVMLTEPVSGGTQAGWFVHSALNLLVGGQLLDGAADRRGWSMS